jgi:hypothetical protein
MSEDVRRVPAPAAGAAGPEAVGCEQTRRVGAPAGAASREAVG